MYLRLSAINLRTSEIAGIVKIPAALTYNYDTSTHEQTPSKLIDGLAEVRDFTGIEHFSELEALCCGDCICLFCWP